jgi:hypothetical protein
VGSSPTSGSPFLPRAHSARTEPTYLGPVRKTFVIALLAALVLPAAALAAPVPTGVVLAVDRKVPVANYMPTRMLPGFVYKSWSPATGGLRMTFGNPAGRTIVWTVAPMTGSCDAGKQKSFQLAGNKVWWAQSGGVQRAWRCLFAADGKARRLTASSETPPTKLADVGLGRVVASARRI